MQFEALSTVRGVRSDDHAHTIPM